MVVSCCQACACKPQKTPASGMHSMTLLLPAGAHSAQDRPLAALQTNLLSMSGHQQEVKEWYHWPADAQLEPVSTSEAAAALPGVLARISVALGLRVGSKSAGSDSDIHVKPVLLVRWCSGADGLPKHKLNLHA